MAVTKDEALATLRNVLQNYVFGVAASRLAVENPDALQDVAGRFSVVENLPMELRNLGSALKQTEVRGQIMREFRAALERMIVREAYEVARWYGEESKQDHQVATADWCQYARVVRHAVSHKQAGIMTEWPRNLAEKGITHVTWRGRTLDVSMVGHPIPGKHCEGLRLFLDIYVFVRDKLRDKLS